MCAVYRIQRKKRTSKSASMDLPGLDSEKNDDCCSHSIDIRELAKDLSKLPNDTPEAPESTPELPKDIPRKPESIHETSVDPLEPVKDTPEYAVIGPSKVAVCKPLPSVYVNITATETLPPNILDPHYDETSCTAPRVMFIQGDEKPSTDNTSLENIPEPPESIPETSMDTLEPPKYIPEPPESIPETSVDPLEPVNDTPEYAVVGPAKVAFSNPLPSGYVNIATETLSPNILDPQYDEASCTAPRAMLIRGDKKQSIKYTPLAEESIQKQGEYSNLK